MEELLKKCIEARSIVVEDDLKTFKLCGREKADNLINAAIELDKSIDYAVSKREPYFFGHQCFVNIENVNKLIKECS